MKAVDDGRSARRRRRKSRAEREESLNAKLGSSEVASLFSEVKAVFEANWPESREWPNVHGLALRLRRPTGSRRIHVHYARVDPERDEVLVVFFPLAIQLCREEFKSCVDEIPHKTWPPGREPLPLDGKPPEIQFKVTPETWAAQRDRLTALVQSIHEARLSAEEDGGQG